MTAPSSSPSDSEEDVGGTLQDGTEFSASENVPLNKDPFRKKGFKALQIERYFRNNSNETPSRERQRALAARAAALGSPHGEARVVPSKRRLFCVYALSSSAHFLSLFREVVV